MSVVPLRRLDGPCPFELCDGSGFVLDEQTNTAYDCRCRPQRVALAKARHLSAVIPRRYADVSFDRPPVTDIDPQVVAATRRFADSIDEQLDAGRGLWFMGPVGTGKTTLAMLVSKAALKAGTVGGDLLAATTAQRDPRHAPRRALARRAARPADRGRPAAHRRRRRRADHRLGARGALLDRQRPLRGSALDRAHDQHPRSRGAVRADHRPDRLAPDRDVRRAAACWATTGGWA